MGSLTLVWDVLSRRRGCVALPLSPHLVIDSKHTQTATTSSSRCLDCTAPFHVARWSLGAGSLDWLGSVWRTGTLGCVPESRPQSSEPLKVKTRHWGMLCRCEGLGLVHRGEFRETELGSSLQGRGEQTGSIQKAQSEIYLILIPQELRKQCLDTDFSWNSRDNDHKIWPNF